MLVAGRDTVSGNYVGLYFLVASHGIPDCRYIVLGSVHAGRAPGNRETPSRRDRYTSRVGAPAYIS